jgi:RNA polymerase primary sigma factor
MKASRYCHPVMKQLTDQQVRYAPRDVRLTQIRRAERLVRELDPTRSYPYHEICERVTTFRPEMYPDLVIQGEDAVHDLRCFVEDLSDSSDLDVLNVDEPVLTVGEIGG